MVVVPYFFETLGVGVVFHVFSNISSSDIIRQLNGIFVVEKFAKRGIVGIPFIIN